MYLAQAQGAGSLISTVLMFVVIGLVFYFMIIKPQKKQQKQFKETLENLKVGDHIITRAGMRGEVVQLKGDSFILESGPDRVKLEFLKQAISYVENPQAETAKENPFTGAPVGDLSYGNDVRFINKIKEIKERKNINKELDILIEDVYEFVVIEKVGNEDNVQKTFRVEKERATTILDQLTELGVITTPNENGDRLINVDPRK